eukprot:6068780-Pyramimonas_sp.AAC.1
MLCPTVRLSNVKYTFGTAEREPLAMCDSRLGGSLRQLCKRHFKKRLTNTGGSNKGCGPRL